MAELLWEPTTLTDLIGKCLAALKEKRRGKLQRGVLFHQDRTALLIRRYKHWLPSKMPASNCSATHRICRTWPPVTSICFQHWRNSWMDGHLLTTMMLSVSQMFGWRIKINNSSTMEYGLWRIAGPSAFLSKGTMLKSDKISCSYFVVNYIRLQTFWMPHCPSYICKNMKLGGLFYLDCPVFSDFRQSSGI